MTNAPGKPSRASPARRDVAARFAIVFAAIIVAWACLHDLHLVRVEPRHFTEFHRPLLPISAPDLLALQYAVVASLGPGLAFGFLACAACRRGRAAPLALGPAALGFACVLAATEGVVLWLGVISRRLFEHGGSPIYPEEFYPDLTSGVVFSQTVNISVYLVAPTLAGAYLCGLWIWRITRPAEKPKS